jgi:hypothetical protein
LSVLNLNYRKTIRLRGREGGGKESRGKERRSGTYEALLHPLSDFTNPNESHILPHSWILIGTWGFKMIRIDPYYQLPSLIFGPLALK